MIHKRNRFLSTLLQSASIITILSGCATAPPQIKEVPPTKEYKALESKKRQYPQHTRNGVHVQTTNTWYLGTGTSYKNTLPSITVPKTSIQKISYEQFKEVVKKNNPQVDSKNYKLRQILTKKTNIDKKAITTKTPSVKPAIANEKHNKNNINKNSQNKLSLDENLKIFKSTDKKPFFEFDLAKALGDVHNQKFLFHGNSTTLSNESRERLVYLAPHLLMYGKIDVIGATNEQTSKKIGLERAYVLKSELLRVGIKSENINVITEQRDGREARLYAAKKRTIKTATVAFKGEENTPDPKDLNRLTKNIEPSKVDWVRIVASSNYGHPVNRSLAIKKALINKGVKKENITILHRQEERNEIKTILYFKF